MFPKRRFNPPLATEYQDASWKDAVGVIAKFKPKIVEHLRSIFRVVDFEKVDWMHFASVEKGSLVCVSPDLGSRNLDEYRRFLSVLSRKLYEKFSDDYVSNIDLTLLYAQPTFCYFQDDVDDQGQPALSLIYPPQRDGSGFKLSEYALISIGSTGNIELKYFKTLQDIEGISTAVYFNNREPKDCDPIFLDFISQI